MACSPGTGKGGGIGDDGGQGGGMNGGTTSIGGTTSVGGSSTGGTGALIGTGGTNMAGSGGMPKTCQETMVTTQPVVPTVAIVVDNSSSMHPPDSDAFVQLYDALMDPTMGAIKPLESRMRLGFYTFRSPDNQSVPETDPMCADIISVPFELDNFDEVDAVYSQVGLDGRRPTGCGATPNAPNCGETQWETPSAFALNRVVDDLTAYNPDPPGPKNILFVTDGTPNTCAVADPNCGQDLAIKAFQDAYAAGINGFIVGVGDVLSTQNCDPNAMHCGADHLQDMANAGAGQPVAEQPMSYWYLQCAVLASGGMGGAGTPQATYVAAGETPGTEPFFTASSPAELLSTLTELLSTFVSCTFDMDGIVTGNPANSLVTLQGAPLTLGDTANGWVLEDNRYQVTLTGAACEQYKMQSAMEGGAQVRIVFYCDPETGEPTIEPR